MNTQSIRKAMRLIEENFQKSLALADVSNECGMSRFHFARSFKSYTGKTFKEYHHAVRIERAKALLEGNDMSISEVCYEVGFNDLSFFDRIFRRFEGMSPVAYRSERKACRPSS